MNFTKPLQWSAGVVALATLLTYTNLLPSAIANIVIVLSFGIIYLNFCAKRGGFSLTILLPITGALAIIFLNQDPTMVSLVLLWMLYDITKNTQFDKSKVAKSFFYTACVGYLLIIGAYLAIGLNKHADMTMWRVDHLVSRASLGFQQPNASMMYALAITIAFVTAFKLTWTKFISGILVASILFHFNQSRTGFILILLLLVLVKFNIKWPFAKLTMISIAVISYALTILPINMKWDELLSGRLSLYQSYKSLFGVHPLGNHVVDSAMIDNGYIQMLLSKGWIFVIFFMISILIIINTKTKLAAAIFAVYILSAFTETTFLHLDLLIPLMIAVAVQSPETSLIQPQIKQSNERYTLLEN